MHVGISTASFYPLDTESSLLETAKIGTHYAEVFINAFSEFSKEFFTILENRAKNMDLKIISIHPFTSGMESMFFFSDYARRFKDGLELYQRFFALSSQIGARYFIFHGPLKQMKIENKETFERFAKLRDIANAEGIKLLQENVARCKSGDVAYIREMREYLGEEVGFVLDTKQVIRSNSSIEEMCGEMGNCLHHIHVSDYNAQEDCIAPGKGYFDFYGFRNQLTQMQYQGDLMIELYQHSYKTYGELVDSYKYLQSIFTF